jgi:hypothetical protein
MTEITTSATDATQTPMEKALRQTIEMAAHHVARNRPFMPFARHTRHWLGSEYQNFFLYGMYGDLTGQTQACNDSIIALATEPAAAEWIENRCLNPYWFWSVILEAAKHAKQLPITLEETLLGVKSLFDTHGGTLGKGIAMTGWPKGYSGDYLPWHVYDGFQRSILWNNDMDRELGLGHGFLLLKRHVPLATRVRRRVNNPTTSADTLEIIFNPVFADLASVAPVVPAAKVEMTSGLRLVIAASAEDAMEKARQMSDWTVDEDYGAVLTDPALGKYTVRGSWPQSDELEAFSDPQIGLFH